MSDATENAGTALIHGVPRDCVPITPLSSFLTPAIDGMLTSFDLQTEEGRWACYAARQAETYELADTMNKVIEVSDIVIHPVEKKNKDTGETDQFFRTVLCSPNGDMYACGSKGVISSLMAYVGCFGRRPPWNPPVAFVLSARGKAPDRYYLLNAVRPTR